MTVRTPLEVAQAWVRNGGPPSRAVEFVAIAIGESSLDDAAVSSAGAIGEWQIMPFNAAPNGFTVAQLYDLDANARIAVEMSGGGTNCAAWDSCYADIERDGRLSFLAWPQQGSADFANLAVAQAALTGHGYKGMTNPGMPAMASSLPAAIAALQSIGGKQIPRLSVQAAATTRVITRIGVRGWRP